MKRSIAKTTIRRVVMQQALLRRAVDEWPQFDGEESVSGGDLVEWFALFRTDAKRILSPQRTR